MTAALQGRVALVTGAAHGIGRALARRFAAEGASVVVADIAAEAGAALAAELGAPHRFLRLDVADPANWQAVVAESGALDLVVLNAGVMSRPAAAPLFDDPLAWADARAYRRLADVNIGGVLHGITACLPPMAGRPGATIVAISSIAGVRAYAPDPIYAATKHAVIGLATSLAPTLEARGVRLLTACPGGIDTGLVPPDLREKRTRDGTFAPPEFLADGMLRVLADGRPGEVWLLRSREVPYVYHPAPVVDRPVGERP